MEKIYSKVEPEKLLHCINRFVDINKWGFSTFDIIFNS